MCLPVRGMVLCERLIPLLQVLGIQIAVLSFECVVGRLDENCLNRGGILVNDFLMSDMCSTTSNRRLSTADT